MSAPQALAPEIDSTLRAAYEIVDELGEGSFGRVYRARQRSTGQLVAIKALRSRRGDSRAGMHTQAERFRREMRLCAELTHPNIVRLIDSGETEEGQLFAVFEFVPGATLKDVLADEGVLPWNEAVHLMGQVLDALACAHARGVVHRDLKPANIMISRTGARRNAMVLDFGLGGFTAEAKEELSRLTATREMMGTPSYAAPEQLRGEPPSTRSDLYSWGLVFLECVTGEPAVRGASPQEIVMHQLGGDPIPIPVWLRHKRVRHLLETVTAKRLEQREVTIEEILRGIDLRDPTEVRSSSSTGGEHLPRLEGERRQLTIISCGLTVSSPNDSELDVEEVDQLLHDQLALYSQLAGRAGGHVESALGDRVLVVFGYPQVREDDARRAARTALQIRSEVERTNARLADRGHLRLEVRMGIHSGVVIVREPAMANLRGLGDLVGLTPQVATRLQELAGPGDVLVTEDTHRLLRGQIATQPAGMHRLPEFSREVPVSRLVSERRAAPAGDTIPLTRETPLVGRGEQLGALIATWNGVLQGKSDALLVTGDPGMGKSRLVREVRRRVPSDAWLEWRCLPENQNSPLRPVVDMLMPLVASAGVDALLQRAGLDPAENVPLLGALLSLPPDPRYPEARISPDRQKDLTFTLILRLVLGFAADRPVVLALEDMHWSDPTTLELVSLLVGEVRAADLGEPDPRPRLMLLMTARPEFSPPWSIGDVTMMPLQRLAERDVEELVSAALAGDTPPPPLLVAEIVNRAEGVPLFAEEVTRVLLEAGGSLADAGGEGRFEVPTTLRDLLLARLDALSPGARETAQLAAVIGREFRRELLRSAATRDESAVLADLRELTDSGVVFHRRGIRGESYVFKHALLRDAAYETMIRSVRRKLHRRVAETLRDAFPNVERDRPEIVAHHFQESGEAEAAAAYWKRAGDRTTARGAYVESIRHFEQGLGLLGRIADSSRRRQLELALVESMGTALLATKGYGDPEVEATFARGLQLCEDLGDVPIRVLYGIFAVYLVRSDADGAERITQALGRLADRNSGDAVASLTKHAVNGLGCFLRGEFTRARELMVAAIEWYHTPAYQEFVREYGYDGGLYPFAYIMWSDWLLGHPDRALEARDQMTALAEESDNPYAKAIAYAFSANLARDRGDPVLVREFTERSIAHATQQKLYFWLGPATCLHGWASAQLGDADLGIGEMQQGLALFDMVGLRTTYVYHLTCLIETHLARGEVAEGLAAVERGLSLSAAQLDRFYVAEVQRLGGELHRLAGDDVAAERALRAALDLARDQQARSLELRAAMSLARFLRDHGRRAEARTLVSGAREHLTEGPDCADVRAADVLTAELA